eukprot:TRINITY_DN200_c0_g1_i1.p1 TRINITY_DN200_c0_g1~~TRINITY_DN200_c0_g1_i1.p1  ORF type:complete len:388 (-),score=81.54 TRINITY_DN200_c0_g1_i1:190-1353(-)
MGKVQKKPRKKSATSRWKKIKVEAQFVNMYKDTQRLPRTFVCDAKAQAIPKNRAEKKALARSKVSPLDTILGPHPNFPTLPTGTPRNKPALRSDIRKKFEAKATVAVAKKKAKKTEAVANPYFDVWESDKLKPVIPPRKKPNLIPAVEVPDPGLSYRPDPTQHDKYIEKAASEYQKLAGNIRKSENFLRGDGNPCLDPIQDYLNSLNEPPSDGEETTPEPLNMVHVNQPFLRRKSAQRIRREKKIRFLKLKKKLRRRELKLQTQLDQLPNLVEQVESIEEKKQKKIEKNKEAKKLEQFQTHRYGPTGYVPLLPPVVLPEELPRNLRNIAKPTDNMLVEKFNNLKKRNLVNVRLDPVQPTKPKYTVVPNYSLRMEGVDSQTIYEVNVF